MPDILHRVAIKSASSHKVYEALSTIDGLSRWWTSTTEGESKLGGIIKFRFANGGFDMKVLELVPDKRVVWQVVDGPKDWVGTKIRFDLEQQGEWTAVMFKHEGWREPVEFMHECSTKWAIFLMSLKALGETGKGTPWPTEARIGNRD